jgi:hypothetical protein
MYRTQITYKDLDDNERTDTLYFRFSESEVNDMQYSETGGFASLLMRIIEAQDQPTMMKLFRRFIHDAYGEKSPDGKAFIKFRDGRRIADDWCQTEAYNQYYLKLLQDPEEAIRFFNGVFPQDLIKKTNTMLEKANITDNPTTQKLLEAVNARIKDSGAN